MCRRKSILALIAVVIIMTFVFADTASAYRPPIPDSEKGGGGGNGGSGKDPKIVTFTVKGVKFEMVTVDKFSIGKTEVTQELWEAVMGSNPSEYVGAQNPVENVSWFDCQEFISRLNRMTGKKFRLPTEAEWEKAARGGKKSKKYEYSGGNNLDLVGWYADISKARTHPVGQKLPNELGIYDMSGNVWEWCQDFWTEGNGSVATTDRVIRGGGCNNTARSCRIASRSYFSPDSRNYNFGLRLAL